MPGGIFVHSSVTGGALEVRQGYMTSGQTFNKGALVQVTTAGTVTVFPEDGSEALVADLTNTEGGVVGVALNGPGTTATAEFPDNSVKQDPDTGNAYAVNSKINYVPINRGILFRTSNILTTGGAAAETAASITGADRGAAFFITYCSSTTPDLGWGVERTSVTAAWATEIYAKIVDVLDANGRSVPTAASVGTEYIFEIVCNPAL